MAGSAVPEGAQENCVCGTKRLYREWLYPHKAEKSQQFRKRTSTSISGSFSSSKEQFEEIARGWKSHETVTLVHTITISLCIHQFIQYRLIFSPSWSRFVGQRRLGTRPVQSAENVYKFFLLEILECYLINHDYRQNKVKPEIEFVNFKSYLVCAQNGDGMHQDC